MQTVLGFGHVYAPKHAISSEKFSFPRDEPLGKGLPRPSDGKDIPSPHPTPRSQPSLLDQPLRPHQNSRQAYRPRFDICSRLQTRLTVTATPDDGSL